MISPRARDNYGFLMGFFGLSLGYSRLPELFDTLHPSLREIILNLTSRGFTLGDIEPAVPKGDGLNPGLEGP
jgi:hypothetical protein